MYYVIDDEKVSEREAFVVSEDEVDEKLRNYSGYFVVDTGYTFETQEDAQEWVDKYNEYEGFNDVKCNCCESGCTMSAFEYAHWNGKCAYSE